jgi:hypothetical protein
MSYEEEEDTCHMRRPVKPANALPCQGKVRLVGVEGAEDGQCQGS